MSEATKFVEGLKKQIAESINCSLIARIIKFDPVKMVADIQPEGLPMIVNVPVALQKAGPFFIRVPYEPGDMVVVVFSDVALDKSSKSRHRLDDAIVVGGITTGALPEEKGLVIAKKDMSIKIVIDESIELSTIDKDINLSTAQGNINISSASGNVNISGKDSSGSW